MFLTIIAAVLMSASPVKAPETIKQLPSDSLSRTQLIYNNINQYFYEPATGLYLETNDPKHNENKHSWLWPLCATIQAANELEALEPGRQYLPQVVKAIDQYYSDAAPAPAYQDYVLAERRSSKFFDDNQWIAIASLDAYQRNQDLMYLQKAKMIYHHMIKSGLDTAAGGGLYWKEGQMDTKNTCSNGPGILVALGLYQATHDQAYLDMALKLYSWTNAHLQAPEGIYYDAIKIPSLKIDKAFYTYNTGTMLQSNVVLYQITKNKKYLAAAKRIAAAGKKHFYVDGKLPGNYWFNAVMLRGYIALYHVDHQPVWIDFFQADAERVWKEERDSHNLLGKKAHKELIDQAGMLEIYARLEQLKIKAKS